METPAEKRALLRIFILIFIVALFETYPAESKGLKKAVKSLWRRFFNRHQGTGGATGARSSRKKKPQIPSERAPVVTPYPPTGDRFFVTKETVYVSQREFVHYDAEDSILKLEDAYHDFAARLYQSQLMMRGALSRLVTAIKRVVLPRAGENAVQLWFLRQRAVNLYFDSRMLALRCLYVAYFPIPTTQLWDVRDVIYRKRKLLHFLGTYHLLDARLTILKFSMEKLLGGSSDVLMAYGKDSQTTTIGAVLQTIGLYLLDGFDNFQNVLADLKEAVVAATVFPHPRDRAYRALHRAVVDVHHVVSVARTALDSSLHFPRGSAKT